jgi:hypothetical protein
MTSLKIFSGNCTTPTSPTAEQRIGFDFCGVCSIEQTAMNYSLAINFQVWVSGFSILFCKLNSQCGLSK